MVFGYEESPAGSCDPEVSRRIRQALESTTAVLQWVEKQLSREEDSGRQTEVSPRQGSASPEILNADLGFSGMAAVQAVRRTGMFDSGAWKWVLSFDDVREVFGSLSRAKEELLRHLFWMARDIIDSDPDLYQEVMRTWEEVSQIREHSSSVVVYNFTVAETAYRLIRQDFET